MQENNGETSSSPGLQAIEAQHLTRIYHLIYSSTSLLPALDDGGRQQIDAILRVAMDHNAERGVTGALAFNDFHFAQVLEGPYEAVKATFASIERDRRHQKIVVLEEGWADARDFAHWAMAFVANEESIQLIPGHLRLHDILARERQTAALALIEMMKFWLLRSA